MPSFYLRGAPLQLPPTPPEWLSGYSLSNCAGVHTRQPGFAAQHYGHQSEGMLGSTDRFGQLAPFPPPSTGFQQAPVTAGLYSMPPNTVSHLYDPRAPTLPSLCPANYTANEDPGLRHRQQQQQEQEQRKRAEQEAKAEEAIGGVSAKLDYEMEIMTDFVSEMAQGMYDLLASRICFADIDIARSVKAKHHVPAQFRKWVHQVLCATRLPSATILLSLNYLATRMGKLSVAGYRASEAEIYRLLTIALVLGSKFLDDNTFQNKSWAEVSGIEVKTLNLLETEWLSAVKFNLHCDPMDGYASWHTHWKEYEALAEARSQPAEARTSSSLRRRRSMHGHFGQAAHQTRYQPQLGKLQLPGSRALLAQYQPSSYAQIDPWYSSRPSTDLSAESAAAAAKTTEYRGRSPDCATSNAFARAGISNQQPYGPPGFEPSPYSNVPVASQYPNSSMPWNNSHGGGCYCTDCIRHFHFALPSGCLSQTVAG